MQTMKKTLTTVALAGALTLGGAGMAQAAPNQTAGAIGGLVAAAVNVDRTVDIDQIQIFSPDGTLIDDINVDVDVNNVLNGLTVQLLNNNDIDVQDVVDVEIVDNVLVVVVDVL
jgi:hypothetical protein